MKRKRRFSVAQTAVLVNSAARITEALGLLNGLLRVFELSYRDVTPFICIESTGAKRAEKTFLAKPTKAYQRLLAAVRAGQGVLVTVGRTADGKKPAKVIRGVVHTRNHSFKVLGK